MSTDQIDPQRVEYLARRLSETSDVLTRIVMYNDPVNGNIVERLLAMNAVPTRCVRCTVLFHSLIGYEHHLGTCPGVPVEEAS